MGVCGSKDSLAYNNPRRRGDGQEETSLTRGKRSSRKGNVDSSGSATGVGAPGTTASQGEVDAALIPPSAPGSPGLNAAALPAGQPGKPSPAALILQKTIDNCTRLDTLSEDVLKTTTSNIISLSHNGTYSMRRELVLQALSHLLRFAVDSIHAEMGASSALPNNTTATDTENTVTTPDGGALNTRTSAKSGVTNSPPVNSTTSSTHRESREVVVRAISQLVRCSRSDPLPVTTTSHPEVLLMVVSLLNGTGEATRPPSSALTLMHTCDLLRYTISTVADREAAVTEGVLPLLQEIIGFSTQLDSENDLVKSAFQALLAISPTGDNGVFDLIYECLAKYFFHSSVVTPALASIMSISCTPEGIVYLIETEVCDLVNKSVTLFKDHKAIHAYAKRVLRNQQKAGPDYAGSPSLLHSQTLSQNVSQNISQSQSQSQNLNSTLHMSGAPAGNLNMNNGPSLRVSGATNGHGNGHTSQVVSRSMSTGIAAPHTFGTNSSRATPGVTQQVSAAHGDLNSSRGVSGANFNAMATLTQNESDV